MKLSKRQVNLIVTLLAVLATAYLSQFQQPATAARQESEKASVNPGFARVTKVIDGDTLDVELLGEKIKVRVIGINTPETVDPRRPVQCFGKEASARAHELLDDAKVMLVADQSQDDVDKYGRSLRFVTLSDGRDYGQEMIGGGFAHEYTYETAHARQSDYRHAEREARENKFGLWSDETCAGNTTKAATK